MRRWWVLAALGTALLLVCSGQTWVTGTATDPVLGATRIEATGAQAGGTLTAGALLAGAALLAGLVGTRPVRLAAAACLAGGGVLAGVPVSRSLLSPGAVAEAVAADRPGAAGLTMRVEDAAPTLWPWIGLLGALLVLLGALLCALVWFRPQSPEAAQQGRESDSGSRREVDVLTDSGSKATDSGSSAESGVSRAATDAGPGRARGQRSNDAWDDLSRGDDPTVDN